MKVIRLIGSVVFVLGLFTVIFVGIPWHVIYAEDPSVPLWLQVAIFCFLGGILLVMLTVALEQRIYRRQAGMLPSEELERKVLLLNSEEISGREIRETLGLVQGHTVFAIWLGKDLSALIRLILGGELTEYTEMMGSARKEALSRMITQASQMEADAVINVRYMTTSVVGSAAELLVYGTAVRLS